MTTVCLRVCRSFALALALAGAALSVQAGERVTFLKPGQEVVTPTNPNELQLPGPSTEFRHYNDVTTPLDMPRRPQVRVEPRKPRKNVFGDPLNPFAVEKPDDKEGKERDADKDDDDLFGLNRRNNAPQPFRPLTNPALRRDEPDRALSPIRQYDWSPDGASKDNLPEKGATRRGESVWSNPETAPLNAGALGFRNDKNNGPDGQSGSMFGFLKSARTSELTPGQLERRSDFEKMINPGAAQPQQNDSIAAASGSPLDAVKPPVPVMAPPISVPTPERRSLDPMQPYIDQQKSWSGPSADDLNRKVFGFAQPSAPPPARSSMYNPEKPPLMRQPTFQPIPSRNF